MVRKRTPLFTRFVALLTIVVLIFCVIYFFLPELSDELFKTSWHATNNRVSKTEEKNILTEFVKNINDSYQESGVTQQEIDKVLKQVDKETLIDAANRAMKAGGDTVTNFVEILQETVNFGDMDPDILKQQLLQTVDKMDFPDAMDILKDYMQSGFDNLEIVVKDLTN